MDGQEEAVTFASALPTSDHTIAQQYHCSKCKREKSSWYPVQPGLLVQGTGEAIIVWYLKFISSSTVMMISL